MRFLFKSKKKAFFEELAKAFPSELAEDVKAVCNAIIIKGYVYSDILYSEQKTEWLLSSDEKIIAPYRVYVSDKLLFTSKFTERQKLIYHCIFSRSHDGYIRQNHIEALLDSDIPEWVIPYIIKVCDEYVMEILATVYQKLKDRNCEKYKVVCSNNFKLIKSGHSRMMSYWNEYYRYDCHRYNDYVGKKLYSECFGYSKTGQKSIKF